MHKRGCVAPHAVRFLKFKNMSLLARYQGARYGTACRQARLGRAAQRVPGRSSQTAPRTVLRRHVRNKRLPLVTTSYPEKMLHRSTGQRAGAGQKTSEQLQLTTPQPPGTLDWQSAPRLHAPMGSANTRARSSNRHTASHTIADMHDPNPLSPSQAHPAAQKLRRHAHSPQSGAEPQQQSCLDGEEEQGGGHDDHATDDSR